MTNLITHLTLSHCLGCFWAGLTVLVVNSGHAPAIAIPAVYVVVVLICLLIFTILCAETPENRRTRR
jgi:hypothetical protein